MSGLDIALANDQQLSALATATHHTKDEIVQQCWNAQDADMLKTVVTSMKKTLN
jgi:hypothetical protein